MKETFGERLHRLRYAKDLTCKELSEMSGLSNKTVICYEYNEYFPSAIKLQKLADALGVTMDYLWRGGSK